MEQSEKLCPLLKLQEQCRGDECAFFVGPVKMKATNSETGEMYLEEDVPMGNGCAVYILGQKAAVAYAMESAERKFRS